MQLILDTENTVDLKTKMSLSEENLEKCISNMPGLQNGIVPNGDITNGDNEAVNLKETNDINNLEQIKDSTAVNTDTDSNSIVENNMEHVSENNSETTVSPNPDNKDCKNSDILNGKDCDNVEPHTNLDPIEKAPNANDIEAKNSAVNEEREGSPIVTESNHEVTPENNVNEHVSEILNTAEPDSNNIELIPESESKIDNIGDVIPDELTDAKEDNDIAETTPNEIMDIKEANDVNETIPNKLTDTKEENNVTEATPTEVTDIAEANHVSETIPNKLTDTKEEKGVTETVTNSITEPETNNDVDIKNEIEDINTEECKIKQEQVVEPELNTESNQTNLELKRESVDEAPVCDGNDTMEMDVSETDIDLIRLDYNPEVCHKPDDSNILEPAEKEKTSPIEPVGNVEKPDDETAMDVDTSGDHVKETEAKEMNVMSPTAMDSTDQKDCEIIENETTTKVGISDLNTKSSDDIIVNLDDDKEKPIASPDLKESLPSQVIDDDDKPIDCDDDADVIEKVEKPINKNINSMDEVIDLDDNVPKESHDTKSCNAENKEQTHTDEDEKSIEDPKPIEPILKLSNTLDILSDDEEEQELKKSNTDNSDNKCINIEDDDDVMLIDDDTTVIENKSEPIKEQETEKQSEETPETTIDIVNTSNDGKNTDQIENIPEKDVPIPEKEITVPVISAPDISEKQEEKPLQIENKKPLLPENFLKTCKKNMVDMTREELEEFCILKIVESILDRSNLSEIKNKLKMLTQNIEDYKKKAMMLQKQNRDLQVVLKSVQEDVKKYNATPIVPLKITRSVGMQVLMSEKTDKRRRSGIGMPNATSKTARNPPPVQTPRPQKPPPAQQIPVPRLVPANNPGIKSPVTQPVNAVKVTSPIANGINKNPSPAQKAEKRVHNRIQSVTVDLTDDEPPTKVVNRAPGPVPPVRLVPSQNLLAPPRTPSVNSPRKVYIPISGPQGQGVRPGQTIMVKTVPAQNQPRQRVPPPHMVRMPRSIQMPRPQGMRHPAPLPECMKQYQPPNWKALPPAPDLKLAKVENGIVISWKIEGYQEDSYEEIASYQLYAYQETTSPPNTALWKKIGDVKALPLPMACTLTQFMAGYKYYFAVRAVDIRSRLGPFSLPGSILLLNKM